MFCSDGLEHYERVSAMLVAKKEECALVHEVKGINSAQVAIATLSTAHQRWIVAAGGIFFRKSGSGIGACLPGFQCAI